MLTMFHDAAVYIPMYIAPDLQAYRNDTFEGWVETARRDWSGDVQQHLTQLRPADPDRCQGRGIRHQLAAMGGIAAGVIVIVGVFLATRNRSTADERE